VNRLLIIPSKLKELRDQLIAVGDEIGNRV
jgi:hypothetical protein